MIFSHPGASVLARLLLISWPLLIALLFLMQPAKRAVAIAFVVGTLFLPEGGYVSGNLPEYTKYSATSFGVLLWSILLDGGRVLHFRPRWIDGVMLLYCSGRVATSLANGLGLYDGLSQMLDQLVNWGVPYWIGRVYFSDREGLLLLAKAIMIGGLIYMPLCLWEVRMSPQLHSQLYGYRPIHFKMLLRYEGFRPIVFTQSSLLVGMWMAAATVMTVWLSASGAVKQVFGIPTRWLVWPMIVTTVLCKTLGATTLMLVGIGLFFVVRRTRSTKPLAAALVVVALYAPVRSSGLLSAERVLAVADLVYDEDRGRSLGVRLRSEDMFLTKVRERPVLGWGGWGRAAVIIEGIRAIPDGLWIILLTRAGWLALGTLGFLYLYPSYVLARRHRATRLTKANSAPGAALAVLLLLYWVDCLSNAMVNLVLTLSIGAVAGWSMLRATRPAPAASPPLVEEAAAAPRSLARGLVRGAGNLVRRAPRP